MLEVQLLLGLLTRVLFCNTLYTVYDKTFDAS